MGATLLVQYGFANAFWAILATGLIIFLAGLPISIYAARHGVERAGARSWCLCQDHALRW